MFYEVTSKRTIMDAKGNDKLIAEKFLVDNIEFFAEAEQKMLEYFNNENEVPAIKQSKLKEFVNKRTTETQNIFFATLESIFVDELTGEDKATKNVVGLFAESIDEAYIIVNEFMKQGLENLVLVGIKKTKIVELI